MLTKLFSTKKKQDPGRHNLNKITMDAASIAILSRHFSPLSCRAKSPSDLLDIVGYPTTTTVLFSPILYRTPLGLDESQVQEEEEEEEQEQELRLTIRNNTTPNHDRLLLETSREDKTLVEEDLTTQEVIRLHQKLIEFEKEREKWQERLQGYIEREEQMRKIIKENRQQLNQLQIKINNSAILLKKPSRNNSYKTVSTLSSLPSIEFDDIDNNHDYYYYPTTTIKQQQPIYYYYYPPSQQQQQQHYYYYYDSF